MLATGAGPHRRGAPSAGQRRHGHLVPGDQPYGRGPSPRLGRGRSDGTVGRRPRHGGGGYDACEQYQPC
ncbi:hypothetical protein SHJG_1863 [Streptomyces hygroscopicus subsp. jinggangensis 5008]|nr:hypothetical protein SHJG_1863 [Streptomyces hygroscopicus subsp. jinggangensis 5008]AGF61294.1 hypothetical protein SHJGH_1628 [Streptomyces hygroscopicus subsp. jinggangensis TL01]